MAGKKIEICLMSTIGNEELSYYKQQFTNFEKEHGVEIIFTRVSWNKAFSWLVDGFKNNRSPDIIQLGTTWVQTLANLGFLEPVPERVKKQLLAGWLEESCQLDGELMAQPWFVEIRALLAWNEILNKAGFDCEDIETSQDFYHICSRLAGNIEEYPFAFPIRPDSEILHRFTSWFWAEGREFPSLEPVPESILSGEVFRPVLDFIARLIRTTSLPRPEMQKHPYVLYREFADQARYAFYQGNWEIRLDPEEGHIIRDYEIMPMPVSGPEGKHWGGGSVLAVSAGTRHKELAWELVNFIISDDFIEPWLKTNGNLPAFSCEFWNKYRNISNVNTAYHLIQESIAYPPHPLWGTVEKLLSEGLSNYLWQVVDNPDTEPDTEELYSSLVEADQKALKLLALKWRECKGTA